MRTHYCFLAVVLIVLVAAVPASAEKHKRRGDATAPKIAFSESYSPYAGFTLSNKYSKLKTYLESEFPGATVDSLTSGFTNLSGYDILILPGRFQATVPDSHAQLLLQWIRNGGCLIALWYPWTDNASRIAVESDMNWGARQVVLTTFHSCGISHYMNYGANNVMTSFASPFGSNPYNVSSVIGDFKTVSYTPSGSPGGKPLAWAGGTAVSGYNDNVNNQGHIYLIGNLYAFQDYLIDSSDSRDFIFNIIHHYLNDGGGGGGGGAGDADLMVRMCKAKFRFFSPGDQITLIARIKNKGKKDAPATDVTFYLSPDDELSGSDIKIDSAVLPALNKRKGKRIKKTFLLPLSIGAGNYYVIAIVDEAKAIPDSDRDNNTKASKKTIEIQ